jgi:hypothetical protein
LIKKKEKRTKYFSFIFKKFLNFSIIKNTLVSIFFNFIGRIFFLLFRNNLIQFIHIKADILIKRRAISISIENSMVIICIDAGSVAEYLLIFFNKISFAFFKHLASFSSINISVRL